MLNILKNIRCFEQTHKKRSFFILNSLGKLTTINQNDILKKKQKNGLAKRKEKIPFVNLTGIFILDHK